MSVPTVNSFEREREREKIRKLLLIFEFLRVFSITVFMPPSHSASWYCHNIDTVISDHCHVTRLLHIPTIQCYMYYTYHFPILISTHVYSWIPLFANIVQIMIYFRSYDTVL